MMPLYNGGSSSTSTVPSREAARVPRSMARNSPSLPKPPKFKRPQAAITSVLTIVSTEVTRTMGSAPAGQVAYGSGHGALALALAAYGRGGQDDAVGQAGERQGLQIDVSVTAKRGEEQPFRNRWDSSGHHFRAHDREHRRDPNNGVSARRAGRRRRRARSPRPGARRLRTARAG